MEVCAVGGLEALQQLAAGEFTSRARRRLQKERFRGFQVQLGAGEKCQGGKQSC